MTQFGAFVSLEPGIEALLHTSQMSDPAPEDPSTLVREGESLIMRVISIESHRQRLGLSLKEVTDEEQAAWAAQHGITLEETIDTAEDYDETYEAEMEAEAESVDEAGSDDDQEDDGVMQHEVLR